MRTTVFEFTFGILGAIFVLWIFTGAPQIVVGLRDGSDNKCGRDRMRIEKMFPAYRWGCYLAERVK